VQLLALTLAALSLAASQQADPAWDALRDVRGSLLFTCTAEVGGGDVYLKDASEAVRRLTVTPERLGIGSVAWWGERIVVDNAGHVQVRELDTLPEQPGESLEFERSGVPAASGRGVLAYARLWEGRRGRLKDEIVRVAGRRRVVIARRNLVFGLYWVGDRLFAHAMRRERGRAWLVEVNRKGKPTTPLGANVGIVAVSRTGRVAYSRYGRDKRVTVMRADGSRRRVFRRSWVPRAWAPDERAILVSNRRRIGLMNSRTGKIRRLGRLGCGYMTSAVWTQSPPDHGSP
jgi:hypothetical protein